MGNKSESLFWGEDTGGKVVKAAWTGTKAVVVAVVVGFALGLGLNAWGSGNS